MPRVFPFEALVYDVAVAGALDRVTTPPYDVISEDQRERYRFRVTSRADAELVTSALYLPQTRWSRVESAIELLQDRVERKGSVDITIPMRRVVAIK